MKVIQPDVPKSITRAENRHQWSLFSLGLLSLCFSRQQNLYGRQVKSHVSLRENASSQSFLSVQPFNGKFEFKIGTQKFSVFKNIRCAMASLLSQMTARHAVSVAWCSRLPYSATPLRWRLKSYLKREKNRCRRKLLSANTDKSRGKSLSWLLSHSFWVLQ